MNTVSVKVLVVGASGYFGRRLVEGLLERTQATLILGSRSLHRAETLCGSFGRSAAGRLNAAEADLDRPESLRGALEHAAVAVCAAGPFQTLPLSLAEACLEKGIHYIDLADDRGFVMKVRRLAEGAKSPAAVCSGWSAVPALSAALAAVGCAGLRKVDSIRVQLAPGNRSPRSSATVASLLSSLGRPFTVWRGGAWQEVRGWSRPRVFDFPPPVGRRQGHLIDVADHELFPDLFSAGTVEFRVGAELSVLDAGVSAMAVLPVGWAWAAPFLSSVLRPLGFLGTDTGAVGVEVEGDGLMRRVCVIADQDGPGIAVMPAVVMAGRLASASAPAGLMPLDRWLDRPALESACRDFGFRFVFEERHA